MGNLHVLPQRNLQVRDSRGKGLERPELFDATLDFCDALVHKVQPLARAPGKANRMIEILVCSVPLLTEPLKILAQLPHGALDVPDGFLGFGNTSDDRIAVGGVGRVLRPIAREIAVLPAPRAVPDLRDPCPELPVPCSGRERSPIARACWGDPIHHGGAQTTPGFPSAPPSGADVASCAQNLIEHGRSLLLHPLGDVPVHVQDERRRRVAEPFRDDARVHPGLEKQRRG